MAIKLGPEEVKEAILEYLQRHRPDFVDGYSNPPLIAFVREGVDVDVMAVRVEQQMVVHMGSNPYRG